MTACRTPSRRRKATVAPLPPGESVFTPREYQRAALADPARFQAWMWSRQTGKGFTVALAVNRDILEREARGEAVDWIIVSRSLLAARQLARKIRGIGRAMCAAMKAAAPEMAEMQESQLELVYPGGSRVIVCSSSPDAAVGFTGNVVIDEIDTHKQAGELLGNTFPVVSTGGYRLIVTSTPRGRRVMHRLATDAAKAGSPWSFRRLTIHEAILQGCDQDASLLQRAILDPLKWRQEYLCEFVDDEICWIPWELITACTDDRAGTSGSAEPTGPVYLGWDIARWNHLSVLWAVEKLGSALRTIGVWTMQRMPFAQQLELADKWARRLRATRLVLDAGGMGEMVYEQAQRRMLCAVEGVKFTAALKEKMAGDVRRCMEDRSLLLPDDEGVQTDFHSLRRSTTSAGNARFEGAAEGSHADRFWACAMAIHGALGTSGGGLLWVDA